MNLCSLLLAGCITLSLAFERTAPAPQGDLIPDWFATSISSAGDVDGDVADDLLIGQLKGPPQSLIRSPRSGSCRAAPGS